MKPYFPYSSNHCPHGSAGGGHCILPDEQIWDYKLLQARPRPGLKQASRSVLALRS